MLHRVLRVLSLALVPAVLIVLPGVDADARLEPKEWRLVKADADTIFLRPGKTERKTEVLAKLVEDGEKRSWKVLADLLVKEAEHWITTKKIVAELEAKMEEIQSKPMAKRYPEEQTNLEKWKKELVELENAARAEHAVFDAFTEAVSKGPQVLRKYIYNKAKTGKDWPVRAAAARVAAGHVGESISFEFLSQSLNTEKDGRVRLAGLDALRLFAEAHTAEQGAADAGKEKDDDEEEAADLITTVEGLIIGRLADSDWGVQLLAVEVVKARQLSAAIPHLINALGFASPRVCEAMAEVLREFTGENFDPYADVWAKWWKDNKERFESNERVKAGKNKRKPADAHFYGLPVNSDRILFIIDTSSSMKKPTKNKNPAEKWKPKAPVTGGDAPPPPPPPEEILSGPKIDVAKHELKKALVKLPPTCKFNIIAFNTAVMPWRDGMQTADAKTKKEALTWVRALEPKGITFIDGALKVAFRMAGLGSIDDKYPKVNIDTIILLSDGAPTYDDVSEVKLQEPEEILQHVREWNRHKRIVIHCVGVDMIHGIEFLKKLAAENGGKYVDR